MKSLLLSAALLAGLLAGLERVGAQTPKLDSLERLIRQAKTDTGRVNLANAKTNLLGENNLDAAIELSKETIKEAQRIKYKRGETKATLKLGVNYCLKGKFPEARTTLRTADQLLNTQEDLSMRCDLYSGYGVYYGMQSKYDSATYFFEKAIHIAQQINHPSLSNFYQNIAVSYQMQSNHKQALAYQQKALALGEKAGNANAQAYSLMNMGLTYKTMGDLVRAEQTLYKAISMARKAGIQNVELYAYSNLSNLYESKRNYPKAYQFASKAAVLGARLGDQGIQAASLAKAASALGHQNQYTKANSFVEQALVVADSARQPLITYQVYAVKGELQHLQNNCREAIPYFEKGLEALKGSDIYEEQIGLSYRSLSECYEKTGNYQKALSAYKTSTGIADSIRSKENIQQATELIMNAEFEKKQLAARAEQQQEKAVATIKQAALGGGLVLTLILAAVAFSAFRSKQKANVLLQQQKEAIENTLTELKTTQDKLIHQEKMASLGELTAGIAHEIQNPLNFVNNFSEVSTELIEELEEEQQRPERDTDLESELLNDLKQNLQKITHHGKRAGAIVKGMLEHSRSGGGEKQASNLNILTQEYLKLAYHGILAKDKDRVTGRFNAELITEFDPNVGQVDVVPQDIGRVLLNLFNNAFYALLQKREQLSLVTTGAAADEPSPYQPTLWVSTRRVGNVVEIRVRDNGTGIPESVRSKIFQPFFTTKPTGQGTGLGLSLSYDIITKGHGGEMSVDSDTDQYTLITIKLPA
ncbi:tetratricopeptide repeat protein [Spirosoma soli]|uniref:histidine kinase n=1 Tax=Spirosoma soli TaxID=1770529 RepID=A0ABW5M7Z3_9BACT